MRLAHDYIIKHRVMWCCRYLIVKSLTIDTLMAYMPKDQLALRFLQELYANGWFTYDNNTNMIKLSTFGLQCLKAEYPNVSFPNNISMMSISREKLTYFATRLDGVSRHAVLWYLQSYDLNTKQFVETSDSNLAIRIRDWREIKNVVQTFPKFIKI